jgi:hypothetical protein
LKDENVALARRILLGDESMAEVARELDLSPSRVQQVVRKYFIKECGLPRQVVDPIGWKTTNSVRTDLNQLLEVKTRPRLKGTRKITTDEMRDYFRNMPPHGYAFSPSPR